VVDLSFTLKVVTPDEVFFEGKTTSVVAPGTIGYLGILRNHAPLVTTLDKGNLTYKDEEGKIQTFKVEGGFLEVLDNRVLVLTEKIQV
jgi:F-type H+-transporting ATPase subunit epsilon